MGRSQAPTEALHARCRALFRNGEASRGLLSRSSIAIPFHKLLVGNDAKTTELEQMRRSTGADKDPRERRIAGVTIPAEITRASHENGGRHGEKASPGVLWQEAPKTSRTTHGRMSQCLGESGAGHEAERLNVELKSMGWDLFEKSSSTLE